MQGNRISQLLWMVLFLTLIQNSVLADLVAFVPGLNPYSVQPDPMPSYFSGTNCCACVMVLSDDWGDRIVDTAVYLNGELVLYTYNPNGIDSDGGMFGYASQFAPGVWFDSTHFPDATTLTVRVEANSQMGAHVTGTGHTIVYNKATIYGRHEWEAGGSSAGTPAANSNLVNMRHSIAALNTTMGWTSANILQDIGPCTAFYVNTHGYAQMSPPYPVGIPLMQSDRDEVTHAPEYFFPWAAPNYGIPGPQVLEVRIAAYGNTPDWPLTPPFYPGRYNLGTPPINNAFLDACKTSSNQFDPNAFAEAFLWAPNDYTDRSLVGWFVFAPVNGTSAGSTAYWSALYNGKTSSEARDDLVHAVFGASAVPTQKAACWGDYYSTLHRVYTGTIVPSAGWWYK